MKNKYFMLFILLLLVINLIACKQTNEDILNEFINQYQIENKIEKEYSYKSKTIRTSVDSNMQTVITNEGDILYTIDEEIVYLNITFELEGTKISKEFEYISERNENKVFEEAYKALEIPSETENDLILKNTVRYGKYTFYVTYNSSDPSTLSNNGTIFLSNIDKDVQLSVNLRYKTIEKTIQTNIKILKVNEQEFIDLVKNLIENKTINENINLIKEIEFKNKTIYLTYESSNKEVLSNEGIVTYPNINTEVSLSLHSSIGYTYQFDITVCALTNEEILEKTSKEIIIPSKISENIFLPNSLSNNITCSWESSDQSLITNEGEFLYNGNEAKNIILTCTLKKGEDIMTKEYNTIAIKENHMFIDRTFEGTLNNVCIENGKLVLKENETSGYYETKEIETLEFNEAVASFSAITDKNRTCEMFVSICVDNKWSKYLSYGEWGLGLENKAKDDSDNTAKLVTDEIKTVSNNANKFKLKINLKRKSLDYPSPIVSLLALTLNFVSYEFEKFDINTLPNDVHYDIDNLYQGDVPVIGGSICSATSSTMLLNYKGHSFKGLAAYEHEYIAYLVRDYGNEIFGNWSYNTITIGAFGENAYVKRFTSIEELMFHLANVGPVAASIKGYVINGIKDYNTAGHLIVVSGYKIENGEISFYIDDPNVRSENVIMTKENFISVYRFVSYVVE